MRGLDVSLEPPREDADGRGVNLYLLELREKPPPRGAARPPLQAWLRYLVTTWSADPADAHAVLFQLLFAAMDDPELEVDLEPLGGETWRALRLPPMPAFVLQVPLVRHRPLPPARYVRQPLRLEAAGVVRLHGTVLAGDVPVPDATVELPALGASTRTDRNGRFRFVAVPADPAKTEIRVRARGFETTSTVKARSDRPVVIRLHHWESEDAGISDS